MNKYLCAFSCLFLLLTGSFRVAGQEASVPEKLAVALVNSLAKEDFVAATANFDSAMSTALPAPKLQAIWQSLLAQAGSFKQQIGLRSEKTATYNTIYVTCEFERVTLDAKVVLDANQRVTGLFFVPSPPPPTALSYSPPDYGPVDRVTEREVVIGSGDWALPGTLTLPRSRGPFPAVVLVHGSGPNDRDESIGPNKPFRDLALGLASRRIAVLRYEKRTKEHAAKLRSLKDTITIKEETLDDALAAVALLRKSPKIASGQIYILGHSLGGTLAPRLGQLEPTVKGLIILAGSSRPLEDLILEQTAYLSQADSTPAAEQRLTQLKQQIARVKDPSLSQAVPAAELPLGVPAAYWLALRGYSPPAVASALKQPMLILQGDRDYQVTLKDFQLWQQALSVRSNVTFKRYPTLNHLFMSGSGKSLPTEYQTPGHVDLQVLEDIATWIQKQ
ncbi:alpha/beta hydrolase [Anthocerotibacter panamensis]|uniref:alpha/beta hydrolase n=1 Tax=Anthocerotibacter panamensis TaxID=2857077 RepID=UPI001C405156|nr:alpha/beta fold hydrolase [Anthocerotibacter panamensis]